MFKKNFHLIFKIINYWFGFNLILVIASNFPHWKIPIFSWVNVSLYFLLFLISIYIIKKDRYNKDIFINLTALFLAIPLLQFSIYVGDDYAIGNNYLAYYFSEYNTILLSLLLCISVVYIAIKYLLHSKPVVIRYILCFVIVIPFLVLNFKEYLWNINYIFKMGYTAIYKSVFYMYLLPLFAIILYGFVLYKYDKPNGEYINPLVVCFFIIISLELVDSMFSYYKKKPFVWSQVILLLNLLLLVGVLFKKLVYTYSIFGEFYEDLIYCKDKLGKIPIKRRGKNVFLTLNFIKAYFTYRKNFFFALTFLLVFVPNLFKTSLFIKINILVAMGCLVIIFIFFSSLYKRRSKKGNRLPR